MLKIKVNRNLFLYNSFLIYIFSRLGRLRSGGAKGPGLFFILPCIDRWTSLLTIIPSPQATVYWWEQPLRWPISTNMQRAAQGKKNATILATKNASILAATSLSLIPKWREDLLPDSNPEPHFIDTDLFPVTKRSTWEPCPLTFHLKRLVTNYD